jgi:hypothetical protein
MPPPFGGAQAQALGIFGGQSRGAQGQGQGGSQSTKVMEDRLADIKDLLAKMLGSQEGHGATAISSLVQGQGGQRRISFGQGQGFGQQGRKRSADDAEGLKWSRRAGAFAGEFVKTLAAG